MSENFVFTFQQNITATAGYCVHMLSTLPTNRKRSFDLMVIEGLILG